MNVGMRAEVGVTVPLREMECSPSILEQEGWSLVLGLRRIIIIVGESKESLVLDPDVREEGQIGFQ